MSDKRLYHSIARAILEMITSGAYPPGTRLPSERELTERFSVSRVVVREAVIFLEALGHLEVRVGAGAYVRAVEDTGGVALPAVTAFELTHTRLMFESECAAAAAAMITDAQVDELRRTVEDMGTAASGSAESEEADRQFHLKIAQATRNPANVFFLQNIWRMRTEIDPIRRVHEAVCADNQTHRVNEHAHILDALQDRDPDRARAAMQAHFSRLLEALLDAAERQEIEAAVERANANRERYRRLTTRR